LTGLRDAGHIVAAAGFQQQYSDIRIFSHHALSRPQPLDRLCRTRRFDALAGIVSQQSEQRIRQPEQKRTGLSNPSFS
jgi:hypothetical protein